MAVYKIYNINKNRGRRVRRRLISNSKDYDYYINQMSKATKEKSQLNKLSNVEIKYIQPTDSTVFKIIYRLLPSNQHLSIQGSIFQSFEANSDQFIKQTIDSFVVR